VNIPVLQLLNVSPVVKTSVGCVMWCAKQPSRIQD